MGTHRVFLTVALLSAVVGFSTPASAQRRGQPVVVVQELGSPPIPTQPMVVRDVRVRDVRVAPLVVTPPRNLSLPTLSVQRPMLPSFSRPPATSFATPTQRGFHGRRPVPTFKSRGRTAVIGYPVIYPYAYPYDPFSPTTVYSPYTAPPAAPNTYSNAGSVYAYAGSVTPGGTQTSAIECDADACGGISFDVAPASAQVSVDGEFVGSVDEFNATSNPLALAPGSHYVEVRLPGYRSVGFDVNIAPGEVTPYQGTLEPLRTR